MDKVGSWFDSVPNSDSSQTTVVPVVLSVAEGVNHAKRGIPVISVRRQLLEIRFKINTLQNS